jgi:hypothetical protein
VAHGHGGTNERLRIGSRRTGVRSMPNFREWTRHTPAQAPPLHEPDTESPAVAGL